MGTLRGHSPENNVSLIDTYCLPRLSEIRLVNTFLPVYLSSLNSFPTPHRGCACSSPRPPHLTPSLLYLLLLALGPRFHVPPPTCLPLPSCLLQPCPLLSPPDRGEGVQLR